jgi:hypothetical protein
MLDRRVRETNRAVIILVIIALGFGGQWVYENLIRDQLGLLNSEQATALIASSLPLGLFLILLFALLGVGDMMYQLYLAPDLELLMAAPVPYLTIFPTKMLQCSRATLIPALGIGAFLIALGIARVAPLGYYPLIILLILGAMLLITALVMIFVILLARLLPAQKVRSWMPAAVILMTIVLALSQQPVGGWFLEQADLITFLTEALLNPMQLGLVVAGLLGGALAVGFISYRIFDTSYHEGWNRFRIVPTRQPTVYPSTGRSRVISRLAGLLPAPMRYILIKEWLELRRNPRGLITLAQPLVLLVFILVPFLGSGSRVNTLQPLVFWFILAFLVLFLSTSPLGTSLIAIAQEGRNIALLRSIPIPMSEMLKSKYWALWFPVGFSWIISILAAGLWMRFSLWQIGFLVGIALWGFSGAMAVTMAIFGLKIDFSAEDFRKRVSTPTSYLTMAVNMIFGLLTVITFVWVIVNLFPDSRTVTLIQAFSGSRVIGWLFSGNLVNLFTLLGGQVVFWIMVKILWDAAVRRLEAWEERSVS